MRILIHRMRFIVGLALLVTAACGAAGTAGAVQLEDTRWLLVDLAGQVPLADTEITLEFTQDVAAGSSGCNSYTASYQVDAETIVIGEITMTLIACMEPEGIMEQEQLYLELLGSAQTFTVEGDRLTLNAADGRTLTFIAAN